MIEYILVATVSAFFGALMAYFFLRKEPEKEDYDLFVVVTPKGELWVLSEATVADKSITGTDLVSGNVVALGWQGDAHPKDFVISQERNGKRMGLLFAASKGSSLAPAIRLEEFVDYVGKRQLVAKLEELLVQVQSVKSDHYTRFFYSYEKLVKAFFSEKLHEHMRAAGALCAKFPTLQAEFIKGYVAAKLSLGEQMTEEDVKEWLENPSDAIVSFARLLAEPLAEELSKRLQK